MTSRPRILLLGRNGQVGYELERCLAVLGELTALGRHEADLTQLAALRAAIRGARPRYIINAAAYTAVDRAEREPDLARAINAEAPGIIGEEAREAGATVIHFSTDYVFDGTATSPYPEDAPTNPLNVYGRTKLEGERRLAASGASWVVLRTGWVYGLRGNNFLLTIRRLAQEREELRVVSDQFGAPTWSRLLASATALLLARLAAGRSGAHFGAVYHLSAVGAATWYEFACAVVDHLRAEGESLTVRTISPISTSDFPTPARRPRYSVLSSAKIARDYGIELPDWRRGLALAMG